MIVQLWNVMSVDAAISRLTQQDTAKPDAIVFGSFREGWRKLLGVPGFQKIPVRVRLTGTVVTQDVQETKSLGIKVVDTGRFEQSEVREMLLGERENNTSSPERG